MSMHLLRSRGRALALAAAMSALALTVGCSDDNDTTGPSSNSPRTFNQVQRLGNPLVSEVFLAKKDHGFHGSIGPDGDAAAFGGTVKGFVAAFRPQATTLQNTLASVLLPDMLIVQTDKATTTAGWLSWALSNGWGGRKLTDDVVDVGLTGIFSDLLDPTQSVCKPFTLPLCTDNVGSHSTFQTAFPYLANPK
ncbi:MAG TPA: DUF4331 family protein [Gemmatimonadaceae bacterium]|nr:DUF4331 family protein [Gemmatimonadaceae bacterium]